MEHKFIEPRRRNKRLFVNLRARITVGGEHYEGIVGKVSEKGLTYTMTSFLQTDRGFFPKGEITITINIPGGEALNLRCELRWFLKPSKEGRSLIMGMQIIEPSSQYREWIQELESALNNQPEDSIHLF